MLDREVCGKLVQKVFTLIHSMHSFSGAFCALLCSVESGMCDVCVPGRSRSGRDVEELAFIYIQ